MKKAKCLPFRKLDIFARYKRSLIIFKKQNIPQGKKFFI